MKIRSAALSIGLLAITAVAHAAAYDFDLSGSAIPSWVYRADRGGEAYTFTDYELSAAVPGGMVPGFTIFAGDTVSGTLTMSDSVTLAASLPSATLGIDLEIIDDSMSNIAYTESLAFYLKGQPVAVSAVFGYFGATGGDLTVGIGGNGVDSSPALTFDQVFFNAQITGIYDGDGNPESSTLLDTGAPYMYFQSYAPLSSVPEPSSGWLALGGLGLVGALARRRS